jgi:hypothetical protein
MNHSFFIAGVQFRPLEAKEAIKTLKPSTNLMLMPEPTNKFDPNAVQIICNEKEEGDKDIFLGYVPKKFSAEISAALEVGIDLECIVESINPSAKPWEMCRVTIKEIENKEREFELYGDAAEVL